MPTLSSSLDLPPPWERGGKLTWWIRNLLFLQVVAVLVSRILPEQQWIVDVASSLFAAIFILDLCWILLSRHIFPFWVHDYSVSGLVVACDERINEGRNVLAECLMRARGIVWFYMERIRALVCGLVARIRRFLSRILRRDTFDTTDAAEIGDHHSFVAVEMVLTAQDSLEAPTLDIMERLDDANETPKDEKQQVSPKLQDKKKW